MSKELIDSGKTSNHRIWEDGDNQSDHLPVSMEILVQLRTKNTDERNNRNRRSLIWKKVSVKDKAAYSSNLEQLHSRRQDPLQVASCPHVCGCDDQSCRDDIQREYDDIIDCIVTASKSLPKCSPGIEKDWWCPELTLLRDQNITIQGLWIQEGRPKQGPTYQERLRVRAAYKNSIRIAKRDSKQTAWNRLHSAMESEGTTSFWRWWKSIYGNGKCQTASVVDGTSSKEGIAKAFQTAFQENSKPNNEESQKA